MNEPEVDDLIRSADPYDPGRVRDLDGSLAELLEEIVEEPREGRSTLVDLGARRRRGERLSLRMRMAVAVGSAAAITVAVGVPVLLAQHDGGGQVAASGAGPGRSNSATASVPIAYTAAAIRVAQQNPRVLVDADGWSVHDVEGFSADSGAMTFQSGPDQWHTRTIRSRNGKGGLSGTSRMNDAPQVQVNWYPARRYSTYLADRRADEPGAHYVTVFGSRALLVNYSAWDHAVLLPPSDGVFLELRASHVGDEDAFLRLLAEHVHQVDVATWLAAMPPEVVTAEGADAAARKILADLPIPPGFDRSKLDHVQALDPYQFGATVTGALACGWIRDWEHARSVGDSAEAKRAVAALSSSHHWKVLRTMEAEGDYPKELWRYADQVVAGHTPHGYASALGCS